MLNVGTRTIFDDDLTIFRETVRKLFAQRLLPNMERHDREGVVDRDFWLGCGEAGLLCPTVPAEYGGLGLDFRFNAVVMEELHYAGSHAGLQIHSDVVAEYLVSYGSEDQKTRYLPAMVSGEVIGAIAMTEPGAGSDLKAIGTTATRDGDSYVLNGSKIYITNGQTADLIIVAAKTDSAAGAKGVSLLLLDGDTPGLTRGRNLDKIGQHSNDTSELFFENARVPAANLLGEEGRGFGYLMTQLPQERLSIAITSQASAQRAFDETVAFTKERRAFGKTVFDMPTTRFTLAELKVQLQVGWAHIDWALARLLRGELTTAEASAAKLWHTEMQGRVVDHALQLYGGAGYMNEYMIARLWKDARVTRIYGGTSEIMKEVVSRAL